MGRLEIASDVRAFELSTIQRLSALMQTPALAVSAADAFADSGLPELMSRAFADCRSGEFAV
jgi:hypothetical protein